MKIEIDKAECISDLHYLILPYFNLHYFTIVRRCEKGDVEKRMLHIAILHHIASISMYKIVKLI